MSSPRDLSVHRSPGRAPTPAAALLSGRAPIPRRGSPKRRFDAADLTRIIRSAQDLSQNLVINVNMSTGVIEVKASAPEPTQAPPVSYDRADAELIELARRHGYG